MEEMQNQNINKSSGKEVKGEIYDMMKKTIEERSSQFKDQLMNSNPIGDNNNPNKLLGLPACK